MDAAVRTGAGHSEPRADADTAPAGAAVARRAGGAAATGFTPGRVGAGAGQWVHAVATSLGPAEHDGEAVEYELVDLETFDLDLLNEPTKPSVAGREYENAKTRVWSEKIDSIDGFVFVTPEYNHSISGSLKNALDFVATEFNHKVAGIVNYGADKGVRAAEHLRHILANYKVAVVRDQASFSIFTDVTDGAFTPTEVSAAPFASMVDDLVAWGGALKGVREGSEAVTV